MTTRWNSVRAPKHALLAAAGAALLVGASWLAMPATAHAACGDWTVTKGATSATIQPFAPGDASGAFYTTARTTYSVSERSQFMLHENNGVVSLVIVHDIASDATGGSTNMTITNIESTTITAQDDATSDTYDVVSGEMNWNWAGCCNDGAVFEGLDPERCVVITPNTTSDVDGWDWVNADGTRTDMGAPDAPLVICRSCCNTDAEVCDGVDQTCEGDVDEGLTGAQGFTVTQGDVSYPISVIESGGTIASYYDFGGDPQGSNAPIAMSERASFALHRDPAGNVGLVLVLDEADTTTGAFTLTASGLPASTTLAVQDDATSDSYDLPGGVFSWTWGAVATDGLALEGLGNNACFKLQASDITGIDALDFVDAAGKRFSLPDPTAEFEVCAVFCCTPGADGCGGDCPVICEIGEECSDNSDCSTNVCQAGECRPATCADGALNGTETAIDCGGDCAPCPDGDDCSVAGDCESGVCSGGTCATPTCTDGVLNGTETGTDCGGSCPACDDGQGCAVPADCVSGVCTAGTCAAPTCDDGVLNGTEAAIDCGDGACIGCPSGTACDDGSDCASGACVNGTCRVVSCDYTISQGATSVPVDPIDNNMSVVDYYDFGGRAGSSGGMGFEMFDMGMLAIHVGPDGDFSLIMTFNEVSDATGGSIQMVITGLGAGFASVEDEAETWVPSTGQFSRVWSGCCTDGVAFSNLGADFCVQLDPGTSAGVTGFAAVNGDLTSTPLEDIETPIEVCASNCCTYGPGECGGTCTDDLCTPGEECEADTDCDSGVCGADGTCAEPTCGDGVQNGDETGVDCGGATCDACPTCTDGIQNQGEADVDCAGPCEDLCSSGNTCTADTDCFSGACVNGTCRKVDCDYVVSQGGQSFPTVPVMDGNDIETFYDYDITNNASATTGYEVTDHGVFFLHESPAGDVSYVLIWDTPNDATGGSATIGFTGLENGVSAVQDDAGEGVLNAMQQASWGWATCCTDGFAIKHLGANACVTASAVATTGIDGWAAVDANGNSVVLDNGLEDATICATECCTYGPGECGGDCTDLCETGEECEANSDCESGVCGDDGTCQDPTCDDLVLNGNETDIDCGGPDCPACDDGEDCVVAADCVSMVCGDDNTCQAPTCTDTIQNGTETDIDCGGADCPACDVGEDCLVPADCESMSCGDDDTCQAPTCTDSVQNGSETDVDCGGPDCPACDDGEMCDMASDCVSNVCNDSGICVSPGCNDLVDNGNETDVDCGGADCPGCDTGEDCTLGSDCLSMVCGFDGTCQAPSCTDGVINGSETDVDCGGADCPDCPDGEMCNDGSDCQSGVCAGGICQPPSCTDGLMNGDETDIDCGGSCPPCDPTEMCNTGADCTTNICDNGTCQAADCTDGLLNGLETDVDCGGPDCPDCDTGEMCDAGTDCTSQICTGGTCDAPTCTDGIQNGDETDVDCGGVCPGCDIGEMCADGSDCVSAQCDAGVCTAPGCSDGVMNGTETDVDCGGDCPDCPDGESCVLGTDCISQVCGGDNTCQPASCTDGVQNGTETDVDCGGDCPGCDSGEMCVVGDDCVSGFCPDGLCLAPTCDDGATNGNETDVDCGGLDCPACETGETCMLASDCESMVCDAFVCAAPTCDDGVDNGNETDVDCGGPDCPACDDGENCLVAEDCISSFCSGAADPTEGTCVPAGCVDATMNGTETDVDCGGGDCPGCADGEMCALGSDCLSGVCGDDGLCTPASCEDAVQNGTETDVDCGGDDCPACQDGQGCSLGSDCLSGVCGDDGTCTPAACDDGAQNGSETDVDCGGGDAGSTCPPCPVADGCLIDSDCVEGATCGDDNLCAAGSCSDGVMGGTETDVDCGGADCPGCDIGESCSVGTDCLSELCDEGVCAAPSCEDDVLNGSETDIDCGGSDCPACAVGQACSENTDCLSELCEAGACAPAGGCTDGVIGGEETDVDCGGSECDACPAGDACTANSDCATALCDNGTCADEDADGDGIPNAIELGDGDPTDPLNPDTDGDGLCDGAIGVAGICDPGEDLDQDGIVDPDETDPNNPDTDLGGVDDGEEVLVLGTDPLQSADDNGIIVKGGPCASGGTPMGVTLLLALMGMLVLRRRVGHDN